MNIKVTKLENGLTIVTDEIPTVASASLEILIPVGSRFEDPSLNGITHFLEHMIFKGTKRRSAYQITKEIESIGGSINASTSRDETSYYTRSLDKIVPSCIDILSDILQNSTFDPVEINNEKKVILQEILEKKDNNDYIFSGLFLKTAFPEQSISYNVLGSPETIGKISRDELNSYFNKNYSSQNMIFSAAGNIEHDHIVDLVSQKFNSLPSSIPPKETYAHFVGGIKCKTKNLEHAKWGIGWPSISMSDPNDINLGILITILDGGMSSRLFQEIREKRSLAYSLSLDNCSFKDTGILSIMANCESKNIIELTNVSLDLLRSFESNITEEEIEKAKVQLKSSILLSLESTSNRASIAANQMNIYGRVKSFKEMADSIDHITRKDVSKLASDLFQRPMTITTLGDTDFSEKLEKFL